MAENTPTTPTEETTDAVETNPDPDMLPRANGDSRQSSEVVVPHTSTPQSSPTVNIRSMNLTVRTAERSRLFADHISSAIEEITPLLEQARTPRFSIQSWLNTQRHRQQVPSTPTSPTDSFVIDLEAQPSSSSSHDHHNHTTTTDNLLNNIREVANEANQNNNNNNNAEEASVDPLNISRETRILLSVLQKYVPYVLILLAKCIYDHRTRISSFVVLVITFIHANNDLRRNIAKQQNRSWTSLAVILSYVIGCIIFINLMVDTHIFTPYTQPITMGELLWSVAVSDFILKLTTIIFKVILTCLPASVLPFQKRGKYYLMVEATSQLIRSVAPIQPWLYYLFEAYQGPEKILGIFLSAAYTVSKGGDLLARAKFFRSAAVKMMQNMNLGVSPSKEQLIASGGICTICHEEYSMPVRLHCKHIFCETCVSTWLDRERSCPLCRASITDDPVYRDGHTTHFIQLY